MIIGFSVMPTETKIKYHLRQRMFSSIAVISAPAVIFMVLSHQLFISTSGAERLVYFYTVVHAYTSLYLTL